MKLIRRSIALAVAALVSLAALPAKAESLGDMMRSAGWDRIFGTWVDADTQGAAVSISYGWKFKDKVVESTVKMGDRESYSLIGINATNGEVFHVGVDSDGGNPTEVCSLPPAANQDWVKCFLIAPQRLE